jgi:hypothetical protein
MSVAGDVAGAAVSRFAVPWLGSIGWPWIIAALTLVISGTGVAGLYFGAQIEKGRTAGLLLEIKQAHIDVLKARTDQYLGAVARGNEVADRFEAALKGVRIEHKTFATEVRREVEKQIYIDCKLPESGIELLRKRIEAANAQILGQATEVRK